MYDSNHNLSINSCRYQSLTKNILPFYCLIVLLPQFIEFNLTIMFLYLTGTLINNISKCVCELVCLFKLFQLEEIESEGQRLIVDIETYEESMCESVETSLVDLRANRESIEQLTMSCRRFLRENTVSEVIWKKDDIILELEEKCSNLRTVNAIQSRTLAESMLSCYPRGVNIRGSLTSLRCHGDFVSY